MLEYKHITKNNINTTFDLGKSIQIPFMINEKKKFTSCPRQLER